MIRLAAMVLLLTPAAAQAHATGRGLVLLLPTGLYITAGVLAVLASVVALTVAPARALRAAFRLRLVWSRAPGGGQTIADGIAVKVPGELTQPIIAEHVGDILLADETALERAV